MELRGIHFAPVFGIPGRTADSSRVIVTETFTMEGTDNSVRPSGFFAAGMQIAGDGVARDSLGEFLEGDALVDAQRPFVLAFRPTGGDASARMATTHAAAHLLHDARSRIPVVFALAPDLSRLSVEDSTAFLSEVKQIVAALAGLGLPLVPTLSVLCPPEVASDILLVPEVDAVLVADSIAWSDMPERARTVFFRTLVSPCVASGGGRVSGKYLLPLTAEWVRQLKRRFAPKPIIAGGGVLRPCDVETLKEAGVSAIALGAAVRRLRPWNVGRIVRRAYAVFNT